MSAAEGRGGRRDEGQIGLVAAQEHGPELRGELVPGPLLLVGRQGETRGQGCQLGVPVGVGHVQVVDQHDVRILQKPVAASVEGRQYRRVDVTAVYAFHSLDLDFQKT